MIEHTNFNVYGVPLDEEDNPIQIDKPTLFNGTIFIIFDDNEEFQKYLDDNYPSDSGEI